VIIHNAPLQAELRKPTTQKAQNFEAVKVRQIYQ
jgi:hypothetical protein